MSQTFVTSFLTTCFEAGLSKEAAAQLLQKESVDQTLSVSQPWAEGYHAVMSRFPGQLRPMLFTDGGIEKSAKSGLLQMVHGLKDVIFGVGRAGGNVAKTVRHGASKVYGPSSGSFVRRFPLSTALGSAAVAGVGGVGAYHWMNRDKGLLNPYGVSDPFFGPSGYDPEAYESRYNDKLYNDYAPGIFDHNKEYFGDTDRRKELEAAVANNQGGGQAYRDLGGLNRKHRALEMQRQNHFESLSSAESGNRELMDRIGQRQQGLETQRTAWWAAPKRWWLSATGRQPNQYYDQQIGQLEDSAAQAQLHARLIEDRKRLLNAGATSRVEPEQPTKQELQEDFFPSYKTD